MTRILAFSILLGLLLPPLAHLARPLLYPSLFLVMLFTLMRIDLLSLKHTLQSQGKQITLTVIAQIILLPILIAALFRLTNNHNIYTSSTILVLCASTLFGAPAIANLLNQDSKPILIGVLISTALLPISLPLIWCIYNGSTLAVDLPTYLLRLLIFIAIPTLLATFYHRHKNQITLINDKHLTHGAITALAIFAIAIMDGLTYRLLAEPITVLSLLALAIILHFALYLLPTALRKHTTPNTIINASILNAYRNVGLLIAITGPYLPADFFLFAGLWQIPMYLSPWILSRLIK